MELELEFADALQVLKLSSKQSYRQLAKAADVSPSFLSELLNGRKKPTVEMMERIARAGGVSATYFREYREHIAAEAAKLKVRQVGLAPVLEALDSLK